MIVLDAMGVLYDATDDIVDVLVPFAAGCGAQITDDELAEAYTGCTLGELSAGEFWQRLGLAAPDVQDRYLDQYGLNPGVRQFLEAARSQGRRVACLSNDVEAWSEALRTRHGLADLVDPWVISAAVKARKPDPVIYRALAREAAVDLATCVFVDDRVANLDTAASLGMDTVLFGGSGSSHHRRVADFAELARLLGISLGTGTDPA